MPCRNKTVLISVLVMEPVVEMVVWTGVDLWLGYFGVTTRSFLTLRVGSAELTQHPPLCHAPLPAFLTLFPLDFVLYSFDFVFSPLSLTCCVLFLRDCSVFVMVLLLLLCTPTKKISTHIYVVTPFCAGGDLLKSVVPMEGTGEARARRWFRQILLGLAYIHRKVR